jgi:hypothetical protein
MNKVLSILILSLTFSSLIAGQSKYKDCGDAFSVCKFGTYYFADVEGIGNIDALNKDLCRNIAVAETNSSWIKFKIKKDGILTFLITPFDLKDDIDFILYNTFNMNCESKRDIRCMATGQNIGATDSEKNCLGATGLDYRSLDNVELQGCKFSDDNFLKFLDAKAGETYTLFINNFDSKNGFSILFDGTGELEFLSDCIDDKNLLSMQLLEIYPNPATNILNVSLFSANNDPVNLELLTLSGQLVTELKHKGAPGNLIIPVDISLLSAGTYLLRIKNNSNNLVEKFVKN